MSQLKGLGLFSLEVCTLISAGYKESIDEIELHLDNKDLVEYICHKYTNQMHFDFSSSTYDVEALNAFFSQYSSYVYGNEQSKFGIINNDDGLLLLLTLLCNEVEFKCHNWKL